MDNLGYSNSKDDEEENYVPHPGPTAVSPEVGSISNNNILKSDFDSSTNGQVIADTGNSNIDGEPSPSIRPGRCGIFCWKPEWLQRFPTKRYFIAVFLFATTIKGMAGSYFPSTISSVEKRLKISTETIGYVMSGNEISQILFALALSYIGGKGHRPRWMALGIFCSAIAYFMYATPHFIYGPGNEALSYTAEYYAQFHNGSEATSSNVLAASNASMFALISIFHPIQYFFLT